MEWWGEVHLFFFLFFFNYVNRFTVQEPLPVNTVHPTYPRRTNAESKRCLLVWVHLSGLSLFFPFFLNLWRHFLQAKEEKDHPECYHHKVQKPASVMVCRHLAWVTCTSVIPEETKIRKEISSGSLLFLLQQWDQCGTKKELTAVA